MSTAHSASTLGLSDRLALERTHLANERTLLAYLRTGMALVIAGFSLINFFRENLYIWVGVFLVPVVLGWVRFRGRRRHISQSLHRVRRGGPNE